MPRLTKAWTGGTEKEPLMADQMTVSPTEPLWDVKKTAAFMAASPSWIYKAASSGVLPAVRVGGLLRFQPQAIIDFIASQAKGR